MSGEKVAGLLMVGWHARESVDVSTGMWIEGRQLFSAAQIERYMDADRVLEAANFITAKDRQERGQRYQEIGLEIGMPRELLTSLRTRRSFRTGPRRDPSGAA